MKTFTTTSPTINGVRVSGPELRRLLYGASPEERAKIAARIASGEWQPVDLLPAQAGRLCAVHPAYVTAARGRTGRRIVDRMIKRFGPEAVFAGLDRATAPVNGNGRHA
jgi:hypothetical protein